ncbi:MAG: hypothetical protein OHK0038_13640 [Flammeovirgaceae bacterium]
MSSYIKFINITVGSYWIEIPNEGIKILCGCPANVVKFMRKKKLISLVEKNGVRYETGANVILLPDDVYQNGHFFHLTEFPILQMLYLQGMIIPNHPNNTGKKPIILAKKEHLNNQLKYIQRGNYGLLSIDELLEAGLEKEEAKNWFNIKLKFAFGSIVDSEKLIETKSIDDSNIILENNIEIKRIENNVFKISYKNNDVVVDLNIKKTQHFLAPYRLPFSKVPKCTFGLVHTGEGDGWDVGRPCMASMIIYKGKYYLIDAGGNIFYTLKKLGISPKNVAGIFHTHLHDDHFAGLLEWVDYPYQKPVYYATLPVKQSTEKKFMALIDVSNGSFEKYFSFKALKAGEWNDLDGLEVMPFYSPHPVETNCFAFRVKSENGYKVYAHLADITSKNVLNKMIGSETEGKVQAEWVEKIWKNYLMPATIKKIDAGGGMIHGEAQDFIEDVSEKIYLSHNAKRNGDLPKNFQEDAYFGKVDVLIE